MLPDQRAAGHLVLSHGAPSSKLAAHAPHGHVAIAARGGDGNDERHLRQQLQQVSDLMRAAHTLLLASVQLSPSRIHAVTRNWRGQCTVRVNSLL